MNNTLKNLFIFAVGAAAGAVATWKLLNDKYDKLYHEEVEAYKEYHKEKSDKATTEPKPEPEPEPEVKKEEHIHKVDQDPIMNKLRDTIERAGYTDYSTTKVKNESEEKDMRPYVIRPEELGDQIGYDVIELTYYADGVVAEEDDVMDDVDEVIGIDSLGHFGQFEEDAVCVRNDRLKCDYQILLDERKYSDVIDKEPNRLR